MDKIKTMQEFLSNLFSEISNEESIYFLAFLLGAFLIGFIISWLLWGSVARRRKKEAEQLRAQLNDLEKEHATLKERLGMKEADLKKAALELEESTEKVRRLQEEKGSLYAQWQTERDKAAKLEAGMNSYQNTIDDLNDQILGLKARNQELQAEGPLNTSMPSISSDRLAAVEQRLALLEGENENLKHQLEQIQHQPVEGFIVGSLSGDDLPPTPEEEDDDEEDNGEKKVEEARQTIHDAIGTKIPVASSNSVDDLTAIEGVGSFLQGKLNELGIYNYDQIAHFDDVLIEQLTTAIEFFPGRIQRDDWAGQAARLHNLKTENPEALVSSGNYPNDRADLKVIEGIGPKIEQILKAAGIQNWEDLAEADVEKMEELLKQAGKEYHMHDPSTWPQQAQLAVNGQWEMLREYQDFLISGRDQS